MPQKKAQFQIKGMTKDIASSKVSSEYAFDIRNMRLVATEDNSTYVLTNERGTLDLEIPLTGYILGQVDTKDGIVVFTHSDDEDRIYYIYINEAKNITWRILYHGNLKFNINNPIDAIASYENESTEKIYWTDGINYPRLINIKKVDKDTGFDTQFDFIPEIKESPIVSLSTASPYKFSIDVLDALGIQVKDELEAMKELSKVCSDPIPKGLNELEKLPILHTDVIEIEEMKEVVSQAMEACFHD